MLPGGVDSGPTSPGRPGAAPSDGDGGRGRRTGLRVEPDHSGRADLGLGTPRHGGPVGPFFGGFRRGRIGEELEESIATALAPARGGQLPPQSRVLPRHPLFVRGRVGIDERADASRLDLGHQDA